MKMMILLTALLIMAVVHVQPSLAETDKPNLCTLVPCPSKDLCTSLNSTIGSILPKNSQKDPDFNKTTMELIASKGYKGEAHSVTTSDGYIIEMHRITGKLNGDKSNSTKKPVAFLQHGLLCASDNFVIDTANYSWGFILSDQGYDVWMGNVRGNAYGLRHVNLTTNDTAFWNFSLDDFVEKDLPACIDKALAVSGQDKLIYLGHSMGTVMAFGLLNNNSAYASKVKLAVLLAPSISYTCAPSLAYIAEPVVFIAQNFPGAPIQGDSESLLSRQICPRTLTGVICKLEAQLFLGYAACVNSSRVSVYSAHFPSGTSSRVVFHFGQAKKYSTFHKYDYGAIANQKKYGQKDPPAYDVKNINTPIGLFHSCNDVFADMSDVAYMLPRFKPGVVKTNYVSKKKEFGHVDFVFSLLQDPDMIQSVLELMNKYK